jgi:hypothetical protein
MVNVDRVKRKLPSLLCDGDTSKQENNNQFMRNRYRLQQFIRRNPQRFNCLVNQLCAILDEILLCNSEKVIKFTCVNSFGNNL